MTYRLTADLSKAGKVKTSGDQNSRHRLFMYFQTIARSVDCDDAGNPRRRKFRNENIDYERTHLNEVWVNDFEGGFRSAESLDDVMAVYDKYTEQLDPTRKVRSDAVLARGAVLALDEQWWKDNCPNWKTEGLNEEAQRMMDTLLDIYVDVIEHQYVMAAILHMDKDIPQWIVVVVPIVDGRYASDKVIPSGLKAMTIFHRGMRELMKSYGYDIELESTGRSTERLSITKYKETANLATKLGVEIDDLMPSNIMNRAIDAALLDESVIDEVTFDRFIESCGVHREENKNNKGVVYWINDPLYEGEDVPPRVYRSASKLKNSPTKAGLMKLLESK